MYINIQRGAVKLALRRHWIHVNQEYTRFLCTPDVHVTQVHSYALTSDSENQPPGMRSLAAIGIQCLRHHYRARNWTFDENHFLVFS